MQVRIGERFLEGVIWDALAQGCSGGWGAGGGSGPALLSN